MFGEGKWNGPGGKLQKDETLEECAIREVYEETGLIVKELVYHGALSHYFGQDKRADWVVHIFSTSNFSGVIKGNEEGELQSSSSKIFLMRKCGRTIYSGCHQFYVART